MFRTQAEIRKMETPVLIDIVLVLYEDVYNKEALKCNPKDVQVLNWTWTELEKRGYILKQRRSLEITYIHDLEDGD